MVDLASRQSADQVPGVVRPTARPDALPSLLWPPPLRPAPGPDRLGPRASADLDLTELVRALTGGDGSREPFTRAVLAELCADPAVLSCRQGVVEDLVRDAALLQRLGDLRPNLGQLTSARTATQRPGAHISVIARRVEELEGYVRVLQGLCAALEPADLRSDALRALRADVVERAGTPVFRVLSATLPELRATLERIGSVTIGINFTRDLTPDAATILSITPEKVEGRGTLLDRLFGGSGPKGLAPLFQVDITSFKSPLFRELRILLDAVVAPVEEELAKYASVQTQPLDELERELAFYLNAIALYRHWENAGLPVCIPEIAPLADRRTLLEDGYNAALALRTYGQPWHPPAQPTTASGQPAGGDAQDARPPVVTNTMAFDAEHARIWILTGPNRGGKTTYTRAVGQAHVLFQAGLFVPARRATLSPVDAIYTHFPTAENNQLGMGKLDEEADRLAQIFRTVTPNGLVLLNEVLAGTSAIEALGLAVDAVSALRLLGVRAIYTTHLHELPTKCVEINNAIAGGSLVGSLVAGVEEGGEDGEDQPLIRAGHKRTFLIRPGPPRNVSYASEIAEQHGISLVQLRTLFRKRGLDLESDQHAV